MVAVPAAAALVLRAPWAGARLAALVYGLTMVATLGISAAYHRGRWSRQHLRRWKTADHAAIFAFIAGSYTPLALLTLGPAARTVFLSTLWCTALCGCVVKARLLERPGGPADALYAATGCWALLVLPALLHRLGAGDTALVLIGLLLYTLSAVVLTRRRPDPLPSTFGYHEVAHMMLLLAMACHFAIYWRAWA